MRFFACLFLLFGGLSLKAQINLTEGKVFFDISYQNLAPEMKRNEHLMPHDASFYFKENHTRLEMGVAGMGKNSTLYDRIKKETTILLYLKGKKFALVQTDSSMKAYRNLLISDSSQKNFSIELTDEYKIICAHKCRKAIVKKIELGITQTNECWYTTDIPPYNTENDPILKGINGFMLEYSIMEKGSTMHLKAKMIMPVPLDNSLFEIPSSYQIVNEKELTLLLSVMQNPSGGQ